MPERTAELRRLLDTRLKEMNVQMAAPNASYDPNAAPANDDRRGRRGGGRKAR